MDEKFLSERLCVCLLCVVAIWAAGCNDSTVGAVPAAGSASVMTTAGTSTSGSSAVTVAGTGMTGTAGVAGVSVPAAGVGAAGQAAATGGTIAGTGGGAAGVGGTAASGASPNAPGTVFPMRNLLLGGCTLMSAVPDATTCTGWDELYECASRNCELAACEKTCAAYSACAGAAPDACNVEATCPKSEECDACSYSVFSCAIEPCALLVRCAMPSADGPCSKLAACCQTQRDPAKCLAYLDRVAQVSGDEICQTFIEDQSVLDTYFNDPPCQF
jgi:hypothetical protein